MDNWYDPSNLWSSVKGATGISNVQQGAQMWGQGDRRGALGQFGVGALKLGSWVAPGGAALRAGRVITPQVTRALTPVIGARAANLTGRGASAGFSAGTSWGAAGRHGSSWLQGKEDQRMASIQRSQAAQYQQEIDRFLSMAGRDASGRRIIDPSATAFPDDPFLQWQPGMTSPFSQEGIQQAGTQVAMNQFGQQLAGLQPTQAAFFQSQLDAALRDRDRALGDIGEQESDVRRRTAQAGRRSRAAGAGEAADLQAAAAARGLMSSPASFDVGQDFIAATTAAEQAQQQAGLSSFLGQAERARGQIESDYRQFMDDVRRQRLAMQMENQQAQQDRLMGLLSYL